MTVLVMYAWPRYSTVMAALSLQWSSMTWMCSASIHSCERSMENSAPNPRTKHRGERHGSALLMPSSETADTICGPGGVAHFPYTHIRPQAVEPQASHFSVTLAASGKLRIMDYHGLAEQDEHRLMSPFPPRVSFRKDHAPHRDRGSTSSPTC